MTDKMENVDPWSTSQETTEVVSADPWGGTSTNSESVDWLNSTDVTDVNQFDWLNPFDETIIPFGSWVETGINWLVTNFRVFFQAISMPVEYVLTLFEDLLTLLPTPFMILVLFLIAWQISTLRLALLTLFSLILIGMIGAWDQMLITLALVLTSVSFCLLLGLPLGIWLSRSKNASKFVTPLLDAMQTTPAFVYLVPIVMLFGIGNVPGVVVTIIFALPPVVRLTILGIKQVPEGLIEAANAFGATPNQLLFKVQLPLAKPSIMAGVNQTLMLSLSMVVIASMIAVGGLGQMVLRGIGRLDMGLAATGGLGIVVMAIVLDRLTQALGLSHRDGKNVHWYQRGAIGLILKLMGKY